MGTVVLDQASRKTSKFYTPLRPTRVSEGYAKSLTLPLRYIRFDGTVGNYATTPDSAVYPAGDMDIRIKLSCDDWHVGTRTFIAKWDSNVNQRSWLVRKDQNLIATFWSTNGTDQAQVNSSVLNPQLFTSGAIRWIRVTRAVATGLVSFYYSYDGIVWFSIGTGVAFAGSNIHDSTAPVTVASYVTTGGSWAFPLVGNTYYAEVRNAIGSSMVANFDPHIMYASAIRTPTQWTSGKGQLWTLVGSNWSWQPNVQSRIELPDSPANSMAGTAIAARLNGKSGTYISAPDTPELTPTGEFGLRLPGAAGAYASTPATPTLRLRGTARALQLTGHTGTYVTTPDSVALSITGDLDLRFKVAANNWAKAGQYLLYKRGSNSGYGFRLHSAGTGYLEYIWGNGSTSTFRNSGAAVPFANGTAGWVRVTHDIDNGAAGTTVTFYTSTDGVVWTLLGSPQTTAGVTVITDSSNVVTLGSDEGSATFAGKIYSGEIRSGIDGQIVANPDFSLDPWAFNDQAAAARADGFANVWTLQGQAEIVAESEVRSMRFPGTAGNYVSAPDSDSLSLKGTAQALQLPGLTGSYVSTPDFAALGITGDIDVRVKVQIPPWALLALAGQDEWPNNIGWFFRIQPGGLLEFAWSTDGTSGTQVTRTSTVTVDRAVLAAAPLWLRVTLDVDNGATGHDVKFYTSPDGVTYTQLGTTVTTGVVTSIFNSTAVMKIGGIHTGGSWGLRGQIFNVEIRNGIAGTIAVNPDFTASPWVMGDVSGAARSSGGATWTLQGQGAEIVATAERRSLRLSGSGSNYASTPDSAALSITGDIDIRAKVAFDNWLDPRGDANPAAYAQIIGNFRSADFTGYRMLIAVTGGVTVAVRLDFGTGSANSFPGVTIPTPALSQTKWLRTTRVTSTGVMTVYTSDDGVTWTSQGTATTFAGTGIGDATWPVEIARADQGSAINKGNVFYAEIRNGIAGTVVANPDFQIRPWDVGDTAAATAPDSLSNTWTLIGAGAVIQRAYASDFDLRMRVTVDDWTLPGVIRILMSKWQSNQNSWSFGFSNGDRIRLVISPNGISSGLDTTSTVVPTLVDGQTIWLRVTFDSDNGAAGNETKFYTSVDGTTWSQVGTTQTNAGVLPIFDSTAPLELNSRNAGGDGYASNYSAVEFRNGIDGTIIANPDFRTRPWDSGDTSAATGVDTAGVTWTINGTPIVQIAYTSDVDLRAEIAPDFWVQGAFNRTILGQNSGDPQRRFRWSIGPSGGQAFEWWPVGLGGPQARSEQSSIAIPGVVNEQKLWVRLTLDTDNGSGQYEVKFYTSTDNVTWTQLGTTKTGTVGPTRIFGSSTAPLEIGSNFVGGIWHFIGTIHKIEVRDAIDGVSLANPDFTQAPWGVGDVALSRADSIGNTWSLVGRAAIRQRNEFRSLRLSGGSGVYASAPDFAGVPTGDIDLRIFVSPHSWRPTSTYALINKWNDGSGQKSFVWWLNTNGSMSFIWFDGTNQRNGGSNANITDYGAGSPRYLRVTLDVDNGSGGHVLAFYHSADGVTWTQLGTDTNAGAFTTSFMDSTSVVEIGSYNSGTANRFLGNIHWAEIRSGINGTTVANPNFNYYLPGDTSGTGRTDGLGINWTLQGAAIISESYFVDLDIRIQLTLDQWVKPSTDTLQTLMARYTDPSDRAWRFEISSGVPNLYIAPWGVFAGESSSGATAAVTPPAENEPMWVRATYVCDDGADNRVRTYYTSFDNITWTMLGTPKIAAGVTPIGETASPIQLGAMLGPGLNLQGEVYKAEVRYGVDGLLKANPDFTAAPWVEGDDAGEANPDTVGNIWTLAGDAIIRLQSEYHWLRLGGSSGHYVDTPDSANLSLQGTTQAVRIPQFAGTNTNITTPDSAALSIVGDIDLRIKLTLDTWRAGPQGTTNYFLCKYKIGSDQRSWLWGLTNTGTMLFSNSANGIANVGHTSTAAVPYTPGQTGWVRVTLDVDNGAAGNTATFYTSADNITWTQLGSPVVVAGVTSIFDSNAAVTINNFDSGANPWESMPSGYVHALEIRNGIGGTIVANPNFELSPWVVGDVAGAARSNGGQTWTLNGNAAVVLQNERRSLRIPGVTGNYASAPDSDTLSLRGTTQALRMPGHLGAYAGTPDSAALSILGDIDVRARVQPDFWVLGRAQMIVTSDVGDPNRRFRFYINSSGGLGFTWFTAGTVATMIDKSSTVATGLAAGAVKWIRATLDVDNGAAGNDVKFYTSDDGVTYTQLGTTVTTAGVTALVDTTGPYELGSRFNGNFSDSFIGLIYYAEVRNGIAGTVVADPDFSVSPWVIGDIAAAARSDGTNTWTLAGNASIVATAERRTLRLSGASGHHASMPDSAAVSITGDIDLRAKLMLDNWASGASQRILSKYTTTSDQRSYSMYIGAGGELAFAMSTDGTLPNTISASSAALGFAAGTLKWVRVTRVQSSGLLSYYHSDDGVTWTAAGTSTLGAGLAIHDGTANLNVGGHSAGLEPFTGNIFIAELRNGIAGTLVANPDFTSRPWDVGETNGATGTDQFANTWTLNGAGAIIQRAYASDLDIRVKAAADNWSTTLNNFINKGFGTSGGASYRFYTNNSAMTLALSAENILFNYSTSTTTFSIPNGTPSWFRATWRQSDGRVQFFTSVDNVTWVQLGANVTNSKFGIYDGTATVFVGTLGGTTELMAGNLFYLEIRNGIDGAVVANPDFTSRPWDLGETNTATGADSAGTTWTLTGTSTIIKRAFVSDLDLRAQVALDDWTPASTNQTLVAKYGVGDQRSYLLWVTTGGNLELYLTHGGVQGVNTASSAATGIADGRTYWVRATWRASDGRVQFFTSADGTTWAQLGIDRTINVQAIFDSTQTVQIGTWSDGTLQMLAGRVFSIEIRNSIGGTRVANPNFFDLPWTVGQTGNATGVDIAGNTWTLRSGAIIKRSFKSDLDLRMVVEIPSLYSIPLQAFIGKRGSTDGYGFRNNSGSPGYLEFVWGTGALQVFISSSVAIPSTAPKILGVRVTLDVDDGTGLSTVTFYWSGDGGLTWAQLGTSATSRAAPEIGDGTVPVEFGSTFGGGQAITGGKLHWAEIRNGINGTVIARPNFNYPDSFPFTDEYGNTYSVIGTPLPITQTKHSFRSVTRFVPVPA